MKDHRFIELLNLYIDRQITAEETAELESEIQSSPRRQAVYRQYCQIHTATKQVYATFRASATEQPVVESGHTGVIELFESRRCRTNWIHYAGGLTAAACLAFAFMRYDASKAPEQTQTVATKPQPVMVAVTPVAPVPAKVMAEPSRDLLTLRNAVNTTPDYTAMLAALREQDEERAFTNERIYVSATPSLFGDGVFETNRSLTPQDQRIFRSRQNPSSTGAQAEFSAFQFQR
ncbi:MAG TPA: hypothetical protein VIM71_13605 [Lacunisphaera sp.]